MKIGVIDYGMGNLHSVSKALASTGADVLVTDDIPKLRLSDLVVLPGVGSFGAAMVSLGKSGLDDFVREWIDDEKLFLGICLGLQLLFEKSEESPNEPGLGIFKGRVVRFREKDFKRMNFQVPHMGWNTVTTKQKEKFGITKSDYFYFVHSYFPEPEDKKIVFTETNYGRTFCSAVATKGLLATQYHPEKSGAVGLKLLGNVVRSLEPVA